MKFIKWWKKHFLFMADGDEGGGGAAGGGNAGGAGSTETGETGGEGAAASSATQSAVTGETGGEGGKAAPSSKGTEGGYWPDDWRTKSAKGDAKIEARFARYASPEAALTALIAVQNRIGHGELKAQLGKNPSPEELTAWRAEQGIPEAPDKYDLDLGGGFVIGEEDKPLVSEFLKAAHDSNQTPDQVKASLRAYYAVNEQITADRADNDRRIQEDATETLRSEWGPDFKRNITLVHNLLDVTTSPEVKQAFLGGRLADGTPIGSSPEALKMLLGLALVNNPSATVVPGANGGNQGAMVDDAIADIEKTMKNNRAAYNKDEKMQAKYRELLGVRETLNKRKVA